MGGRGRCRRKGHLDKRGRKRLESVGECGDVVARESDQRGGVRECSRGDRGGIELGESTGRGGWALPWAAINIGLRRIDGVSPGKRGGVLRAGGHCNRE